MPFVVPFSIWLVASTPLLPMWPTAHFLEFAGPTLSGPMGDAPASICGWTPMGTRKARLVRADKGIFCLCPIGPVGHIGIQECWRGYKGPMGRRSGECMGGGNLGMGVCKHTVPFFFAPRSLQAEKAKGQGGPPWPFSRGCQTYWEACQKCGVRPVKRFGGTSMLLF